MKRILLIFILFCVTRPCFAQDWSVWKYWFAPTSETLDSSPPAGQAGFEQYAAFVLRYAKSVKSTHIGIRNQWQNPPNYDYSIYRDDVNSSGMKYYLMDPAYFYSVFDNHSRFVGSDTSYTAAEKDWYKAHTTWKRPDSGTTTFPHCLADGYHEGGVGTWSAVWDFQQQTVVTKVVQEIIDLMYNYRGTNTFEPAGVTIDVPRLYDDFHLSTGQQTKLATLTGISDSCYASVSDHGSHTHTFATHSDGVAAFFAQLKNRMRAEFGTGNVFLVTDPSLIYDSGSGDTVNEFVYQASQRSDKLSIGADMYVQENGTTTAFVDDLINQSGTFSAMSIAYDMVGNGNRTSRDLIGDLKIAVACGTSGSWYNWFMQFNIGGHAIGDLTACDPWLLVSRIVPNWDNLSGVGTPTRSASGTGLNLQYWSPRSYMGSQSMHSIKPGGTATILAVFRTTAGSVTLPSGYGVTSAYTTNVYLEAATVTTLLSYSGSIVNTGTLPIDTGSGTAVILNIANLAQSTMSGGASTLTGAASTRR